jgi:hypothetical protein
MQREEPPVMTTGLERIAVKARCDPKLRFTSLAHHITKERVWESLSQTPAKSAAGVDGQANLESSGFQRTPKYDKDTILTVALLFAQLFGAFSNSLKHFFHPALLLGRDILKCTFDESGELAEDRNEYSASLLRKRNNANAAIALALHTTD